MPNLPTHMSMAKEAAGRLSHPIIDRNMGTFLLGSTSPDIRIMTKWQRDQTHFAPLSFDKVGAGAEGMFQRHSGLADWARTSDQTKAFVSGYVTHLVSDETWIVDVYRTCFDGHSDLDQVRADLWDRALQLDMDMASIAETGDMSWLRTHLDGAESGVDVGFIGSETLTQWREWVSEFTTRAYSWERLRGAARRMYRDRPEAEEMAQEFLRCLPDSLKTVYCEIPESMIAAYRDKAIGESVRFIREYLHKGVPE